MSEHAQAGAVTGPFFAEVERITALAAAEASATSQAAEINSLMAVYGQRELINDGKAGDPEAKAREEAQSAMNTSLDRVSRSMDTLAASQQRGVSNAMKDCQNPPGTPGERLLDLAIKGALNGGADALEIGLGLIPIVGTAVGFAVKTGLNYAISEYQAIQAEELAELRNTFEQKQLKALERSGREVSRHFDHIITQKVRAKVGDSTEAAKQAHLGLEQVIDHLSPSKVAATQCAATYQAWMTMLAQCQHGTTKGADGEEATDVCAADLDAHPKGFVTVTFKSHRVLTPDSSQISVSVEDTTVEGVDLNVLRREHRNATGHGLSLKDLRLPISLNGEMAYEAHEHRTDIHTDDVIIGRDERGQFNTCQSQGHADAILKVIGLQGKNDGMLTASMNEVGHKVFYTDRLNHPNEELARKGAEIVFEHLAKLRL